MTEFKRTVTNFDIAGFGICAVDFVGLVDKYPAPNEKVPMAAFSKQGGGNTGTALVAAARLGAKPAYIGKLGLDEYSLFILDEFEKEGVDFSHVVFERGVQPHISFIHVDAKTGDRRITRYWRPFTLEPEKINKPVIANSKILFLDHYYPRAGLVAAKCCKESGGNVVVDAERMTPGFAGIVYMADYVIASHTFATNETGDRNLESAVQSLFKKFGGVVVVTAGASGAYCQTDSETIYQPAFKVKAVDTTGAGDVFHGAFMVGLLNDWPLRQILEFSAAAAALKCRGLGGRAMIPSRKEAIAYLLQNGRKHYWTT